MAYIGIGFTGESTAFLRDQVNQHMSWLKGDRLPHFFGDRFLIMYDSNTAREFVKKVQKLAGADELTVYPMGRPFEQ